MPVIARIHTKLISKIQVHDAFGENNTFNFRNISAKIEHTPFIITKMGAIEREDFSTTYWDDFGQTILLIKLLAAFFPTAEFPK